jgi:hypothetical protein
MDQRGRIRRGHDQRWCRLANDMLGSIRALAGAGWSATVRCSDLSAHSLMVDAQGDKLS